MENTMGTREDLDERNWGRQTQTRGDEGRGEMQAFVLGFDNKQKQSRF